ncbi:DUF1516 family protein [Mammaliicoccus sp. Dog046]|uniref:DUF1516 family protein n=1 Tax=Mammaliicoccus sp. Dog046 TaxID=3034233 RepID=UPI002B258FB9|nr:DUF1516 family protein [Mammaliicoccus sp. Dog046]WQK84855.1 DUF1516 family protein [Mammaliicoccus sp. Dog046]
MIHFHIFSWLVMIILFFVVYMKVTNKPVHMVLRLFMVFVLISGIYLFIQAMGINGMLYGIKLLLGIAVLGLIEVTIAKKKKNKNSNGLLIATVLVMILTILLGSYLPMGVLHFG